MDENHRIRQALKSPAVMIGLCLIAGYLMYSNLQDVIGEGTVTSSTPHTNSPLPVTAVAPQPRIASSLDYEKIAWIDNPHRDPFTAQFSERKNLRPSSDRGTGSTTITPLRTPKALTLKAVAIEDQSRSAVINRSIVYEGETFQGYTVMSILPKGVWLSRKGKKQFLAFSEYPPS